LRSNGMAIDDKSEFGNVVDVASTGIDIIGKLETTLTVAQKFTLQVLNAPLKAISVYEDYNDFRNAGFSPSKAVVAVGVQKTGAGLVGAGVGLATPETLGVGGVLAGAAADEVLHDAIKDPKKIVGQNNNPGTLLDNPTQTKFPYVDDNGFGYMHTDGTRKLYLNPNLPPGQIADRGAGIPSYLPDPYYDSPSKYGKGNGYDGPGTRGEIPSHLKGNKADSGNGYDGPGSAGKIPAHLTGAKASSGGNSTDTPSGGTPNKNYQSEATTKGKGGYQPTSTKTTTTTKTPETNKGSGTSKDDPNSANTITKPSVYKNEAGQTITKTNTKAGPKPVVLDLDNDGIEITELSRSTTFMDADGDGLVQRTAWAGAGDGVLFYDAGNDGLITEKREYVFTEWDPTATSDLKALKAAFDSNGDGKLTVADADFAKFKVMVTNADGTQQAMTLAELGITEINLNADVALVTLPDGSQITGTATFLMNGQTRTLADTVLAAEAQGYRVEKTPTVNGTYTIKAYDASGNLAYSITNTTSANGLAITNLYDDNGDGVVDRIQTIDTTINATTGERTETVVNKLGNVAATAIIQNKTVTTTSADGKSVTIQRDTSGGGWYDQVESRIKNADNSQTNIASNFAKGGTTLLSRSNANNNRPHFALAA
jgi:hypothetical protein